LGLGGAGTLFGGKFCLPPASSGIWKKTNYTSAKFEVFKASYIAPFLSQELLTPEVERLRLLDGEIKESFFNTQLVLQDDMRSFVLNLKEHILASGVDIRTKCRFDSFKRLPDGSYDVFYSDDSGTKRVARTNVVIIASGRSSFDTAYKWFDGFDIVRWQSPDLGIRLTLDSKNHPAFAIGHDRKLKMEIGNIDVRTFCVCAGGDAVLIHNKHLTYYDGHFLAQLTSHVNLGILARSSAIMNTNILSHYCDIMRPYINSHMSTLDFINFSPRMAARNRLIAPILHSICEFINKLVSTGIIGNNINEFPVFLPSVDRMNPLVSVNENFETPLDNVYVVGDSTGISRGFIQSLWSGYCAAKHILGKLSADIFDTTNKKAA